MPVLDTDRCFVLFLGIQNLVFSCYSRKGPRHRSCDVGSISVIVVFQNVVCSNVLKSVVMGGDGKTMCEHDV